MYQVVIDTDVLVAALLSNRGASHPVLRLVGDPRWRINLSVPLVFEYEQTLKRVCPVPPRTKRGNPGNPGTRGNPGGKPRGGNPGTDGTFSSFAQSAETSEIGCPAAALPRM